MCLIANQMKDFEKNIEFAASTLNILDAMARLQEKKRLNFGVDTLVLA
jgi:hypothetical protein